MVAATVGGSAGTVPDKLIELGAGGGLSAADTVYTLSSTPTTNNSMIRGP